MDDRAALDLAQQGMQVALMVSLPVLAVALFVGLVVSVFQAVTQVHEMTLTFVPKMVASAVVLAFMGDWMLGKIVAFTVTCFEQASRVAG